MKMATPTSCFICSGSLGPAITPSYLKCDGCGHELLIDRSGQNPIVNEPLTMRDVRSASALDKYKDKVLRDSLRGSISGGMLDIGSASGKYLYRNKDLFPSVFGLEVTPAAVEFARKTLGLTILEPGDALPEGLQIATAWHSLEHIPPTELQELIAAMARSLRPDGLFLVSVPNGSSWQFRWMKERYPYFDVPTHEHQFTHASLLRLFATHGFAVKKEYVSWPYNSFGYVQGLLNLWSKEHNYFYYRMKRRTTKSELFKDLSTAVSLPIALPLGYLLGVFDSLMVHQQGVLTICFQKKSP